MRKVILKQNVIDLATRLWDLGLRVDLDPTQSLVTIHKKDGGYEWIDVAPESSVSDIVSSYLLQED